MLSQEWTYIVFAIVLVVAVVIDLGLLSKRNKSISMRKALIQTGFWIGLSLLFGAFLFFDRNSVVATKYLTAYLLEWSLSIDNIFVFIIIFTFLKVKETDAGRALLVGILLAIIFRVLFIAAGLRIIDRFHWIMYIFGAFLIFTGFKMFFQKEDDEFDPGKSKVYQFICRVFKISDDEANGRFIIRKNGKMLFTSLSVVVVMLGATDIVFALDSIPTVVSLVRQRPDIPFSADDKLVIYSSNIFAVLGLRSLFFLLRGAVDVFAYLQQGIAIVLTFIGVKMLLEYFNIHLSVYVSLLVIVACLGGSIAFSLLKSRKQRKLPTQS